MKTVLFYSFRGGTGCTTVLANVAVALCQMGKNVCMLDFNFEAPGLDRWPRFRPDYETFRQTFIQFFSR